MKWVSKQKIAPTVPPIVIQAPLVGNIKQRSIDLSNEIMEDLYRNGWPQRAWSKLQRTPEVSVISRTPTTAVDSKQWMKIRSSFFRWKFIKRILEIRNEFSQLHLRDQGLDDFFNYQGMIEDTNKQLSMTGQPQRIDNFILPQQIESVAESLVALAEQVK